jgi:PilZ domain-containing protein
MTKSKENSAYSGLVYPEHEQRRTFPRYPFSGAVEAIDSKGNIRIMGRLSDISRSGCYIDTINPFAPGATVELTIVQKNQFFKTRAKVVYSQPGMGMGISFTIAEPDELRKLDTWLNQLSGADSQEPDAPSLELDRRASPTVDYELRSIVRQLIVLLSHKEFANDPDWIALLGRISK